MIVLGLFITAFVIGLRMGVVYERTRQAKLRQREEQMMEWVEAHFGSAWSFGLDDKIVVHTRADFQPQQRGRAPLPPEWEKEPADETS